MNSENSNLKSYRHKVGQNWYHVVLVTKYRNPVFRQDHQRQLMVDAINWVCPRHNIDVFKYEIMDEHVHLFISAPHKYSISKAIQIIKGATSYYIRRMHPPLRRYASFWHRGGMFRSVGNVSAKVVEQYIKKNTWALAQQKLV
jgi:putative transposase